MVFDSLNYGLFTFPICLKRCSETHQQKHENDLPQREHFCWTATGGILVKAGQIHGEAAWWTSWSDFMLQPYNSAGITHSNTDSAIYMDAVWNRQMPNRDKAERPFPSITMPHSHTSPLYQITNPLHQPCIIFVSSSGRIAAFQIPCCESQRQLTLSNMLQYCDHNVCIY